MGMRLLTKRFSSYRVAQFEKKYNKDFLDFIDIGNLSFSKIIILIQMGNEKGTTEEQASDKLDNYLADENHSIVDAYLQVLDELNRDTKILKGTGLTIDKLRKDIYEKVEEKTTKVDNNDITDLKITETSEEKEEPKTIVLKDNETPKVDDDGFVSLD